MLNLNNANVSDAPQMERTLIPAGTVCRAVVNVKLGDMEIPEFGTGQWFKKSQTSKAKWMELEFTVIGGEHDKRKFWDKIFVDGDKMSPNGIPVTKEIGLSTLRMIIESAFNIVPTDTSAEAQARRQISGVNDLNGMEICAKVGIDKGTNGYADKNKLTAAMTPNQKDFIPSGQAPMSQTPASSQQMAQPQQQAQPVASGAVPSWANR
jgi:hypothetical protein|tara:strand:+ start:134 stop:757 length:624 start_codon:yes stop_codon:yes gene_type:complete